MNGYILNLGSSAFKVHFCYLENDFPFLVLLSILCSFGVLLTNLGVKDGIEIIKTRPSGDLPAKNGLE